MRPPAGLGLERELGTGGGGEVWLARTERRFGALPPGTLVALKRPRAGDDAVRALEREAEIGVQVLHPHLAELVEHGTDEAGPYLVTRFLPGPTLGELLREGGPLPEPLLRRVGGDLAGALAALHAAGWIHGDVGPENVRLDEEGRAVLIDLGLARTIGDPAPEGGSLAYWAPELLAGDATAGAVDVFALGVVLYELGTGTHPFLGPHDAGREGHATDAEALLRRIAAARAARASHLAPRLSPLFDAAVDACMRRDPRLRPTARELAQVLGEGEASAWWRGQIAARLDQGEDLGADRFETHLTPFVGRREVLRELHTLYRDVAETHRGAVRVVRGPVGIGKARLVSELVEGLRAGDRPCTFLHATCSERGEARPFGTLTELLERWLQLGGARALGPREVRLLTRRLPPRDAQVLERALDPAGAEDLGGSFALSLAEWVVSLTHERPVVLAVDQLEEARPATLAILRRLFERAVDAPLMLLLLVDDDRVAAEAAELRRVLQRAVRTERGGELRLGPLGPADVEDLVARMFHHSAPRLRLARVLWSRSRGNPELIEELVRSLEEQGRLEVDADGWRRPLIPPDAIPLPASLGATVRDRYRELDPPLRRWLERLAVAGGRLEPEFLARAFPPTDADELGSLLADLARRGWLEASGGRYRFARPSYRDAVYRATAPERRSRLHRMVARALDRPAGDDQGADFQRAFHLRAADEHGPLLELVERLLPELERRASPQRLLRLARWGLEALDALAGEDGRPPEDRRDFTARLLERGIDAAHRLGDRSAQRRFLDRLAELPPGPDETRDAARLYLLHGEYAFAVGDFGLARGMLRGAVEHGDRAELPGLVSRALRGRALIEAEYDELRPARDFAARALDRATDGVERAAALLVAARVELLDDWIERTLDDVARALAELRDQPHREPGRRAAAQLLRARVWRAVGRTRRALAATRHAIGLAREGEERGREVELVARLGWLLIDAGRLDEAEALLRDAQLQSEELEDQRASVLSDLWLGILLLERQVPGARTRIQRALRLAGEIGFHRAEAVGRAVHARIAAREGHLEAARVEAAHAAALVAEHGAEIADRIVVLGTHALAAELDGRASEARTTRERLERRVALAASRIRDARLRRDFEGYSARLAASTADLDSPVYPRTAARAGEDGRTVAPT